jgi:metallo-beta-lactamase family protein
LRIRFLGAAQEVTGSMHLLELEAGSILIDCGMFQGRRAEARRRNQELPHAAVSANAMILTHAHIDHSGSVPTLVKAGFTGPIFATAATSDLCGYMLRDSARIQKADAAYLNRKFADDPHFAPIEPIYEEIDVERALGQFVSVAYHQVFHPLPGVTARLLDAGHILGSAEVILDVEERGTTRRLVFSGDLGRRGLPILRDPEVPPTPVDYLVLESTYGDRLHDPIEQMHDDLERVIRETVSRGGKIIVPAFAVGRTQELIYALNELVRHQRLPSIEVYIDSPLANHVTEVFQRHPECFDAETQAFLEEHGEVFRFEGVHFVSEAEDSIRLNDLAGPAVIISASGMCEAGRILHHLRNHIEDPRNTILIVGFMAEHTLGRRIAERQPKVKIWGVERDLRAQVVVLDSFSAHADRDDLIAFADACGTATRRCFLVHGEPEPQGSLRHALEQCGHRVHCPIRGEIVELD